MAERALRLDPKVLEAPILEHERRFGTDIATLILRVRLGAAYQHADRHAEAIAVLTATLADFERLLGADDPFTCQSRARLAEACKAVG